MLMPSRVPSGAMPSKGMDQERKGASMYPQVRRMPERKLSASRSTIAQWVTVTNTCGLGLLGSRRRSGLGEGAEGFVWVAEAAPRSAPGCEAVADAVQSILTSGSLTLSDSLVGGCWIAVGASLSTAVRFISEGRSVSAIFRRTPLYESLYH